ncbi:MAG: hypothetical protein IPM29_18660 [Planctomycetes bacterium]|nr:hypothetical protein [Planctomycetota bacterium]
MTMRTLNHFAILSAWLLTVGLTAQGDAQVPNRAADDDGAGPPATAEGQRRDPLEEFAKRVQAAHQVQPRATPVDRFRASIAVEPVDPQALGAGERAVRGEIRLEVSFIMPRLLRYRIEGDGETVEEGLDERGEWLRIGNQLHDLRGRDAVEFAEDRENVRRNVRLARQLLSFVDPAATLRALTVEQGPEPSRLRFGKDSWDATVVQGRLEGYPFYVRQKDAAPAPQARLSLWFGADDRLLMVRAVPLDAEGTVAGDAEWVKLEDYEASGGLLVPHVLRIYQERDRPRPVAKIRPESIEFADGLDPRLLARPGS